VVVVSALAGRPNALIEIGDARARASCSSHPQIEELRGGTSAWRRRPSARAREADELAEEIGASFDELAQLAEALSGAGSRHAALHERDRLDGRARLGAAARRRDAEVRREGRFRGRRAKVMCTDDAFGARRPQAERSPRRREHCCRC